MTLGFYQKIVNGCISKSLSVDLSHTELKSQYGNISANDLNDDANVVQQQFFLRLRSVNAGFIRFAMVS